MLVTVVKKNVVIYNVGDSVLSHLHHQKLKHALGISRAWACERTEGSDKEGKALSLSVWTLISVETVPWENRKCQFHQILMTGAGSYWGTWTISRDHLWAVPITSLLL